MRRKYVYVISSSLGYQKIGWTIDVGRRLSILNQGHPLPLLVHRLWERSDATLVERSVHRVLKTYEAPINEWFNVTPDYASMVVDAVIEDIDGKVPWVRKRRKPMPDLTEKARRGRLWSEDRKNMLVSLWVEGVSSRRICERINALPGSVMQLSSVSTAVRKLGLSRPTGYTVTHDSDRWSVARDAVVREMYATNAMPSAICDVLNSLPGDKLDGRAVASRAARLGVLRPSSFGRFLADTLSAKTRGLVWTEARESFLKDAWIGGMLPFELMQVLVSMPGPQGLTWDVIRDRAKARKLKRPPGFLRDAMIHIADQAPDMRLLNERQEIERRKQIA